MEFYVDKHRKSLSAARLPSAAPPATAGKPEARLEKRNLNLRPLASLVPYVKRYRWRAIFTLAALILAAVTTFCANRGAAHDRFRLFGARGCADRSLFPGDDRRRGGVGGRERTSVLSRQHPGRAHRRRLARRRLRSSDIAVAGLLRRGQDRRTPPIRCR